MALQLHVLSLEPQGRHQQDTPDIMTSWNHPRQPGRRPRGAWRGGRGDLEELHPATEGCGRVVLSVASSAPGRRGRRCLPEELLEIRDLLRQLPILPDRRNQKSQRQEESSASSVSSERQGEGSCSLPAPFEELHLGPEALLSLAAPLRSCSPRLSPCGSGGFRPPHAHSRPEEGSVFCSLWRTGAWSGGRFPRACSNAGNSSRGSGS